MKCSPNCRFGWTAGIAAMLAVVGAVLLGVWPTLFDFILSKNLALSPNSYSYDLWKNVPIPVYMDFYMFNWTNPEDILHHDPEVRRPKFVELGPYVFKEQRTKVVLGWNNDNNTVAFYQNRTWHFVPELSSGRLDDNVTTLNVPALAAAFTIRDYPGWVKLALNLVYKFFAIPLVVEKTVGQLLFGGYDDILLNIAALLPPGFLPTIIPFDKFGWLYTRNGSETYDGIYNMFTGKGDMKRFGEMDKWNGESFSDMYDDDCARINGSAGEFIPPKPKKGSKIYIFSTDICRSVYLQYKEETRVDGIGVYRYWGDEHVFKNVTERPENWCYCPSGECPPSGAIDVSRCKWGTPAFVSFPHFFHGDPYFRESVEGMKPDIDKHMMFLDLEKHSGLPVQAAATLQINMRLRPYPEYDLLNKVPNVYFPLIWFVERASLSDDLKTIVRLFSYAPLAVYIVSGILIGVGVLVLIISSVCYLNFRKKKRRQSGELKNEN